MSTTVWKETPGPILPKVFYAGRGGYALETNGRYIPLPSEGQVRAHILRAGADRDELMALLCDIREKNYVAHIGPVAGFPPGLHTSVDSGENFLVTTGPAIVEGIAGKFPFIKAFLRELLEDSKRPDQYANVWAWLSQARRNLMRRERRPLPALVLVGPVNGGKSLFIELTRQVLGGRSASAMSVLNGTSVFNADVCGAELLTVDDEIASRDHRMRVAFAHGIKRHFFNGSVRVEQKYRDALTLRPIQALVVSVNDEVESLRVLPPLDESLNDKITLVFCGKASLGGLDEREAIAGHIREELPALVERLDRYVIPPEQAHPRTGVRAWHHPRVLRLLREGSPEEVLRELLSECPAVSLAIQSGEPWDGTAAELQGLLVTNPKTAAIARSLLSYAKACGELLGKLRTSGRGDISRRKVQGITRWKIRSLG